MPKPIDPDDLAFGTILRVLTLRLARLERGAAYMDGLDAIREHVIAEIGRIPMPGVERDTATTIRAQAQAIAEHLLAREGDSGPSDRAEPGWEGRRAHATPRSSER